MSAIPSCRLCGRPVENMVCTYSPAAHEIRFLFECHGAAELKIIGNWHGDRRDVPTEAFGGIVET